MTIDRRPAGLRPSRREAIRRCGMGFGALGLTALLGDEGLLAPARADGATDPLAPRRPPLPATAKHVIHIFLNGGPSHVDTFDPKPALSRYAGKSLPSGNLRTERKTGSALPSPFKFRRRGESGLEISEIFANVAEHADDLCVVRSMYADVPNHEPSLMLMNCGDNLMIRPSMGAWVTYGLGTENQNLPGFVAMCPGGYPIKETENWQSAFLPGVYQGTYIDSKHTDIDRLIEDIRSRYTPLDGQRRQLDLLRTINEEHASRREHDAALEARIQSFELAYRMQMEAAEAFDVRGEPRSVLDLYGPGVHARQLLVARRLVERGVRFVQLWHGAGQPWDDHGDITNHRTLAAQCDRGIAALLTDLKRTGLLGETLVICGGEFGRTPVVELMEGQEAKANGRDHNPYGFSLWMAGGGVKGGHVHGATDEFGFQAVEDRVHVHDLHATILRLLGFDHERFTYRYAGRDFRLTDVHGRVVESLVS
ncbi:DUF1501 domain-containing protein [Tautonia plasticadhaerens]|uniref:Sulfatase n=1 Tax=Tautonia plasticadhaerens TaxID=2527974 RepID=A0A518H1F3_9BACT|nr:DUF1501 domain-containing protein [Tautonia plasticadhaerens]QDV34658.1 hypothetical protein ElP_25500 [Tautonia plasticadhaerens]